MNQPWSYMCSISVPWVRVSSGCHSKWRWTRWLKTTEMYSFTVRGTRTPNSKKEGVPRFSPSSGWFPEALSALWLVDTPPCLCLPSSCRLLACLSSYDLYTRSWGTGSRACSNPILDGLGLPTWNSAKETPFQGRGHGFDLWSRKIPHARGKQSPCATTPEATFWSPRSTEEPPERKACTRKLERSPTSLQLEKAHATRESPHTNKQPQILKKLIFLPSLLSFPLT